MELATKGLIGASLLVATTAPTTVFLSSSNNKPPKKPSQTKPKTLQDYRTQENKDKYLYYFTKLFVEADSSNKDWWDNSFSRLLEDKAKNPSSISSKFNLLSSGYGDGISLSTRCSNDYMDTFSNINDDSKDTISLHLKNFWRYCTIIEAELELVTATSEDQTIKSKHKNILIAAEEGKNTKFWEIQNEAFFGDKGIGSSATQGTIFHTLYSNKTQSSPKTLREACLEAYKKNTSDSKEVKDTLTFCSISNKQVK